MRDFIKFLKDFDRFDFGWLVLSLGMAIGSGIVIVPITVGANGFLAFLVSILIAYPGIFFFQKLYMHTLIIDSNAKTYSDVIYKVFGKFWAGMLSVLYLVMMLLWVVVYSVLVTKTLAEYFYRWGLTTNPNLQDNHLFSFILLLIILFLGLKSQKLLVKASSAIVFILILSIIVVTFALIPSWNISSIQYDQNWTEFVRNTIVMVPFFIDYDFIYSIIKPYDTFI